jgi:hypothetical protein
MVVLLTAAGQTVSNRNPNRMANHVVVLVCSTLCLRMPTCIGGHSCFCWEMGLLVGLGARGEACLLWGLSLSDRQRQSTAKRHACTRAHTHLHVRAHVQTGADMDPPMHVHPRPRMACTHHTFTHVDNMLRQKRG